MRRFLAPLAVAALALSGCGGGSTPAGVHKAPVRTAAHCSSTNWASTCDAHSRRLGSKLASGPVVATGIDFAWACPNPHGWGFGVSYLSYDSSKNWTRSCLNWYHSVGVKTVNVWETTSSRALAGFGAGVSDAREALRQATALGAPASRPIYFAVDFDTSGGAGSILSYFRGVSSVLGAARVGVYGGYASVQAVHDAGLGRYFWQTSAWSGGAWTSYNNLEQYAYPNNTYDLDRALTKDYGQNPYAAPPVYPVCYTHRIPAARCRVVKAQAASDTRAAASSWAVYDLRGGPVIAQRIAWFAQQIKAHPRSSQTPRRRLALAASRTAWNQRHLGVFLGRYQWFMAQAAQLQRVN